MGHVHDNSSIGIECGYRPGLLARCTELHALYYARESGFGRVFEAMIAGGLAEFSNRLDNPCNQIWYALKGNKVLGTIAVDGEDLGDGKAHLRWFIMDDETRGQGVGRKLLSTALHFCDKYRFSETHLWTFKGLDAARHLYEANGFQLAEERPGEQWEKPVLELLFIRRR